MKFDEIKQLDEVRMAQSNLNQFLNSPRAAGIRSGFEAELIFSGLGEPDYDNAEYVNDYDYDERTRSIDNIINFFSENMGGSDLNELRDSLVNDYLEWRDEKTMTDFDMKQSTLIRDYLQENGWNEEVYIREYLADDMDLGKKEVQAALDAGSEYGPKITSSKQQREIREKDKNYDNFLIAMYAVDGKLDELVQEEIDNQGDAWQAVYDEFMEGDDYDEDSWLSDSGPSYMSDVESNYVAYWPHLTTDPDSIEGGYNTNAAEDLASNLESTLGVDTVVSNSYHGESKDATSWYFEPDGSLKPNSDDDMPVEIVSPPMSLKDTHDIMPRFFAWVEDNNGYANKSTGFHMSLSMPEHDSGTVDYLKLALFLGDEYVLKQFGREANDYCRSSLKIIKDRLKKDENPSEKLATAFDRMRNNMIQLASNSISQGGQGKFVTIHNKGNYIEFRSAGASNYFGDIDRVQNTLLRYAYAMSIASDPAAERQEYAKKLYKLLSETVKEQGDVVQYFVKYSAGQLPRSELVSFVKQARIERQKDKQPPVAPAPRDSGSQDWEIVNTNFDAANPVRIDTIRAINREHAYNQALQIARRLSSNPDLVRLPRWWDLRQIQPVSSEPTWPFDSASPP